jgi:hypothetical protein
MKTYLLQLNHFSVILNQRKKNCIIKHILRQHHKYKTIHIKTTSNQNAENKIKEIIPSKIQKKKLKVVYF